MMNLLTTKLKNTMRLGRLQQDKEMITQQDVCWINNISNALTNKLQSISANKKSHMLIKDLFSKLSFIKY